VIVTRLMPHQERAVAKLRPLRIGALFMEMGLGKSLTMMRLIEARRERISRVLWFCPVSLKATIRRELEKHCPGEAVDVFDGRTATDRPSPAYWHIIGIESMSSGERHRMAAANLVDRNTCVVVDESTYIKGNRSRRTRWITAIGNTARYRYLLTGTPFTQGVVDLYAQMRFLDWRILGYKSFYTFAANHLEYSEKYPGMIVRSHNTGWLATKIAPYVYQLDKDEALTLPPKRYESRYFEMTNEQRDCYEWAKTEILSEIMDEDYCSHTIFRLFTALQQIVNGYWNRRDPDTGEVERLTFKHRRLDALRDILEQFSEGEKVIIWAKYRRDIRAIADALPGQCALFYGDLNERARDAELQKFRAGAKYFVATASCGGHGLTLNEASHVVFYNNEFKFSNRLQAEDRCHRIGQVRTVTYVDVVCTKSIDERIGESLAKKSNLLDDFKRRVYALRSVKKMSEAIKEIAADL
jgi:SNF2 family DNA or RNA helicase